MEVTAIESDFTGAVESNPMLLISDALKLEDEPAEIGLTKIDDFLVSSGRDKINEQLTHLPGGLCLVAGEEDSVMQFADTLKEMAEETIKSAFNKIEELQLAIRFPVREASPTQDEEVVAAVCTTNTVIVNKMLKTTYESGEGNYDSREFGTALILMVEMASMRGDLETTLEYCKILEMLSPDRYEMFLGMAYFAAARLGDEESRSKLDHMLDAETEAAYFKRVSESEEEAPYNFTDEHLLLLAVSSEYIEYGMSPDEFIEAHTMFALPGEDPEVEEEVRWNLKVETYDYKRIIDSSSTVPVSEFIDKHLKMLCDDELSGLDPRYVWGALPRGYELTEDVELKLRIINKYLELAESIPSGEEDSVTALSCFDQVSTVGFKIIEDSAFISEYPYVAERFLEKLITIADSLRPFTNIKGENTFDEILQHFKIHSTAASGEPTDVTIALIEKEVARRAQSLRRLAGSDQADDDFDLEEELSESAKTEDDMKGCAAKGYALVGRFGDSQTLLTKIVNPTVRKNAYVDCWSIAENVNQVQILAPDEVTSQVFFDEDDPDRPETDAQMGTFYRTALITASGDVDKMVGRAQAVSMLIGIENEGGANATESDEDNDAQIESNLRFVELMYGQLDTLVSRVFKIDGTTAQTLAFSLLPERLKGPMEFIQSDMLGTYYEALEVGLRKEALELIGTTLTSNPTDVTERRAGSLAEFTKTLYRKQFTVI